MERYVCKVRINNFLSVKGCVRHHYHISRPLKDVAVHAYVSKIVNDRWLIDIPMTKDILQRQAMIHISTERHNIKYNLFRCIHILIQLILLKRYRCVLTDYLNTVLLLEGNHLFLKN